MTRRPAPSRSSRTPPVEPPLAPPPPDEAGARWPAALRIDVVDEVAATTAATPVDPADERRLTTQSACHNDRDGDGTADCDDGCPDDPAKTEPGACGCGATDADADDDGTPDCDDGCPDDPDKTAPGACGCGVADDDSDDDGTPDCLDGCPDDPDKTAPGACGCGVPDVDSDGDGVPDCDDVCPGVADPDQADCDGDGTGDACAGESDCNANGVPDSCDITDGTSTDVNLDGTPDECEGFRFETGTVAVDGTERTVALAGFLDPVVVCTVQSANNAIPVVARVRNVGPFGFDVRLVNPSGAAVASDVVHWLAMEAGTWDVDGVRCEAQRTVSTVTDDAGSWVGEAQTYGQAYVQPVVIGQVMTANDADWSFFWCRGGAVGDPPSAATLFTGKSVAEDPDTVREDETLAFIVFEAGHGTLGDVAFDAVLSGAIVAGVDNAPPYAVAFDTAFAAAPSVALLTIGGMNGTNGGWAVLDGAAPLSAVAADAVVDEDQLSDAERAHIAEQVAAVSFATAGAWAEPVAAGFDVDRDGDVDADDLVALLGSVGSVRTGLCEGDLDLDGLVTADDVARFMARTW